MSDLHPAVAPTSPHPLFIEVDHASGSRIYDTQGRSYIDMISGIGVSNLGHAHPRITRAIKEQVDRHLHVMVYGEFGQSSQSGLCEFLASQLPDPLDQVYLVNSGTEAIEATMKLGRRVTGRTDVIYFEGAYHGNTLGALSIASNETKKYRFRPLLPGTRQLPWNDIDALSALDDSTAIVILETVQGDAGVRIPDREFLLALRERCDEVGALLAFDEIQCGMGRTGSLFAFEQFGVVPDVVVLGKALGGGMNIGAFCAARQHMEQLSKEPTLGHITTFGGHPVNAAAGLAFLSELLESGVLEGVENLGRRLEECLAGHPKVTGIRRIGAMLAVDLSSPEQVAALVNGCMELGVLAYFFLSRPSSFRLAPPLNISEEDLNEACRVMVEVLDDL